jgi:hypothetical protein
MAKKPKKAKKAKKIVIEREGLIIDMALMEAGCCGNYDADISTHKRVGGNNDEVDFSTMMRMRVDDCFVTHRSGTKSYLSRDVARAALEAGYKVGDEIKYRIIIEPKRK